MGDDHRPLNIVNLLDSDWERDYKRPHLQALGERCYLLCIEPPISLDLLFRKPQTVREWLNGRRKLRQIGPTLWLYKPISLVPYAVALMSPILRFLNGLVLKHSMLHVIRQLNMEDIILMIAHPAHDCLIGQLGERVLAYEVYDEYAESLLCTPGQKQRIKASEERILRKADIVFCSARNLTERKRLSNPNTHFVPNAADVTFFMKSLDPSTPVPSDLLQIPEPRIGLIGNINDIVDMGLLVYLAEQRPDWSIVLIGAINGSPKFQASAAFQKSKILPNLYLMGFRDYTTLPGYQKGLNVCLLPYLISEYTVNVYPNKVHQYLAGGKPVVSTDLPEMRSLAEVVDIAQTPDEFRRLVDNALHEIDKRRVAHRVGVAQENTVERRAQMKIRLLESTLSNKTNRGSRMDAAQGARA